ncbi:MAG: WYL domain-containing protein [Bacilli bacterium]|nr:WYL domain-containing protein [Bacilli bacterium]
MGKAGKCIQMLQILRSGRLYKAEALAELLDTSPRNVIEYRKELNRLHQIVASVPGKNGGYRLARFSALPAPRFTEGEVTALTCARALLKKTNPTASEAIGNVLSAHENGVFTLNPPVFPESVHKAYVFLEDAIHAHRAVDLVLKDGSSHLLSPLDLRQEKSGTTLLGFDMRQCRMLRVDLACIESFALSKDRFVYPGEDIRKEEEALAVTFFALPSDCFDLILDLPDGSVEAKQEQGSVRVCARFEDLAQALGYCLSHQEQIRVNGPDELVDALHEWAENVAPMYAKKATPSKRG